MSYGLFDDRQNCNQSWSPHNFQYLSNEESYPERHSADSSRAFAPSPTSLNPPSYPVLYERWPSSAPQTKHPASTGGLLKWVAVAAVFCTTLLLL